MGEEPTNEAVGEGGVTASQTSHEHAMAGNTEKIAATFNGIAEFAHKQRERLRALSEDFLEHNINELAYDEQIALRRFSGGTLAGIRTVLRHFHKMDHSAKVEDPFGEPIFTFRFVSMDSKYAVGEGTLRIRSGPLFKPGSARFYLLNADGPTAQRWATVKLLGHYLLNTACEDHERQYHASGTQAEDRHVEWFAREFVLPKSTIEKKFPKLSDGKRSNWDHDRLAYDFDVWPGLIRQREQDLNRGRNQI